MPLRAIAALCKLVGVDAIATGAERIGEETRLEGNLDGEEGECMKDGWVCRMPSGGGVQVTMAHY